MSGTDTVQPAISAVFVSLQPEYGKFYPIQVGQRFDAAPLPIHQLAFPQKNFTICKDRGAPGILVIYLSVSVEYVGDKAGAGSLSQFDGPAR